MVERDGDVSDAAHDDLAVAHNRTIRDSVDAEDRDLWVVDERRGEKPWRFAGARDGERAAAQLLRRELAFLCSFGEMLDVGVELVARARTAAAHDRHHE